MTKTNIILILVIIVLGFLLYRSNDSKKLIELEQQKEIVLNKLDSINLVYDSLNLYLVNSKLELKKQSIVSEYWYSKYYRSNKNLKTKIKKYENFNVHNYNDSQFDSIISRYKLDKKRTSRINTIKSN